MSRSSYTDDYGDDLWRLLDANDPASAVHAPCVARKARAPEVERKTWAQGFGALL